MNCVYVSFVAFSTIAYVSKVVLKLGNFIDIENKDK